MKATPANIFTIAPGADFARSLAKGLIARLDKGDPFALVRATIYLPTQRAARVFGDAFAAEAGGAALLPNFRPLGDVDEDEMLFGGDAEPFDLPPAIAPARRRFLLAMLIRRWHAAKATPISFAQSAGLAKGLAELMDDMERQGASPSDLANLAPENFAEHWRIVTDFLSILKDVWPGVLEEEAALNPAARRNKALAALAARLQATPPNGFVIAAGSTGSIPATAELLSTIARLPQGAVILPGLDQILDRKSWDAIGEDPGHPQFGMRQLLARMSVAREDVKDWDETKTTARIRLLSETLRPAPATDAWQKLIGKKARDTIRDGLEGLSLIEAADPAEEARIVALLLRQTLESKEQTAALVTPDRTLGRRVAAELRRFDIDIDDSGGTPLAHTPPGTFLCLLAEAAQEGFAPVKLLALLKHPLAAHGGARGDLLSRVRQIDRALRGPRPDPGLDGIAAAIEQAGKPRYGGENLLLDLSAWFATFAKSLRPFADLLTQDELPLSQLLEAHLACGEALAHDGTNDHLWRGPAGDAMAKLVAELQQATRDDIVIDARSYAALFRTLSEEKNLRPPYGGHPRLSILGPLEARLLSFDRIILGGLNEAAWPRNPSPDPWFSRPMRKTLGLEQPERAIGLAAHDFAQGAANSDVFLTRALKAQGAPTVASRWVQRLVQLTRGLKLHEALVAQQSHYADIARQMALVPASRRITRPAPTPPVKVRPRQLSVTQIENWMRDPYAIYARYVLRLRKLDPLEAEIGPMERGNTLHKILEVFVRDNPGTLPPDAAVRLIDIADRIFAEDKTPQANLAVWRPRFLLAVPRLIDEESKRRTAIATQYVEISGQMTLAATAGDFTLTAKADRIDILKSGGATILDYKSGNPPSAKQVSAFLSPQLLLEGVMLKAGGFPEAGTHQPVELVYIGFGGKTPGEYLSLKLDVAALVSLAEEEFAGLVAKYDDPAIGYPSHTIPIKESFEGDYDHLARVREWSLSGGDAE